MLLYVVTENGGQIFDGNRRLLAVVVVVVVFEVGLLSAAGFCWLKYLATAANETQLPTPINGVFVTNLQLLLLLDK